MKRIIHNYFYNLGYQFITLIIPFLTIPYITRVLGPENLGIEAYTMSIASIFIAFATAGTTIYATRLVASIRDNHKNLTKYVYNVIIFRSIIAILVISVFIFIILNSEYRTFLFLQLVFMLASTLFDSTWYFTGKERFKEITIRNIFIKIIGFLLTIILVKDTGDLNIYILINGITLLVPNFYFSILLFKEIGKPKKEYFTLLIFRNLIRSLLPFLLLTILIQIYMNFDKLIIEQYKLTYELGIYSQIIKVFNVFLAPITALGTILMPYVSNLNHHQKSKSITNVINLSTNLIALIGIPIFFGLLLIAGPFIEFYFGEQFIIYTNLFRISCILILTGSISNIIINQVILPNNKENIYIVGLIYATLIRLIVILTLITSMKIYATVIAYILSELFLLIWCIYKTKNFINTIPILFNLNNLKILFSGFLMYFIVIRFDQELFTIIIFGCILYIILLIVFNENMMRNYVLKFKRK